MSETRLHTCRSAIAIDLGGLALAAAMLATSTAAAEPLAQAHSETQLAEAVQSISQDPSIAVDDPATRPLVQAVLTEGVRQLHVRAYDQALANFLDAYARFPSPAILLTVSETLRDMGRLADAANTYQRYLGVAADNAAEIKALLATLDQQLTVLTVHVVPPGASLSVDGGPFLEVAGSLVTRVQTGPHLIRIRKDELGDELRITGTAGEHKDVVLRVPASAPTVAELAPSTATPTTPTTNTPPSAFGWLIAGTQYGAVDPASGVRTVHDRAGGRDLAAIVPQYEVSGRGDAMVTSGIGNPIQSGLLGTVRIDGKGRGFAGGFGLAISLDRFEAEIMFLESDEVGGYLGARYQFLAGWFLPYAAAGVPGFVFDHNVPQPDGTTMTTKRLAIGVRAAAGIELKLSRHVSVQGDLGVEHFFFADRRFESTVFVPTLGMIGWL